MNKRTGYSATSEIKVKRKRRVAKRDCSDEEDDCSRKAVGKKGDSVITTETEISSMKSTLLKVQVSLMEKLEILKAENEKKKSKLTELTESCKQIELDIKSEGQKLRDVIGQQEQKLFEELESVASKATAQNALEEPGTSEKEMSEGRISFRSNTDQIIKALDELDLGEIEVIYEEEAE